MSFVRMKVKKSNKILPCGVNKADGHISFSCKFKISFVKILFKKLMQSEPDISIKDLLCKIEIFLS